MRRGTSPSARTFPFAEFSGMGAAELAAVFDGDPVAAAEWLAAAAKYGIIEAQAAYAQLLLDGRGVARDPAGAFAWFSVAAGAGWLEAANMVGRCHELGWGVPANPEAAATHYRRAAERGLDWAQYNLAGLLLRGVGLPCDPQEAFAWYLRAARLGHAKSMNLVGRFLEEGWAGRADPVAAFDWYRRAAEGGDFRGQFNHATLLARQGRTEAAASWFCRAAATGTPGFLRGMAQALGGHRHPELRAVALAALARCCETGEAEDLFAYGRALAEGAHADPALARHWLRLAKAGGHMGAAALLRRLARADQRRALLRCTAAVGRRLRSLLTIARRGEKGGAARLASCGLSGTGGVSAGPSIAIDSQSR